MMPELVIWVDAGGSKSVGQAMRLHDGAQFSAHRGTCVPSTDMRAALSEISLLVAELREQACVRGGTALAIASAGIDHPDTRKSFEQGLAGICDEVLLISDGEGALLGCLGDRNGAIISVGTGVVGYSRVKGRPDQAFDAWGWPAGDRGGGGALGLSTVSAFLAASDTGTVHDDPLFQALAEIVGQDRPGIFLWLSRAERRDYAALAATVVGLGKSSKVAHAILTQAGASILLLADRLRELDHPEVCITGGLAEHLLPFIPSPSIRLVPNASLAGARHLADRWLDKRGGQL